MPGTNFSKSAIIGAALLCLSTLLSSCSSPEPAPPAAAPGVTPQLWGEMKPVVSVKELMRDMIDPLSDYVFDSVGIDVTKAGTVERMPKTEEDWAKIRFAGVSMAEAAYLLKVRRPFAPEGDLNNSTGPEGTELSPAAITAKVEKDPVEWNARIEALRNVGLEIIDIANRKNASEMWGAGEDLDVACENCHKSYWYPAEDAKFYENLYRKLDELTPPSTSGTTAKPK